MPKRLLSAIVCLIMILTAQGAFAVETATADVLSVYPAYPSDADGLSTIRRNADFSVSVTQGGVTKDLIVYNATREGGQYKSFDFYRRFCEFAFSGGAATVNVTVNNPAWNPSTYEVLPSPFGLASARNGNTISVTVDEPTKFLIRLGSDNNTLLSIFADASETGAPNPDDPNVFVFDSTMTSWNTCTVTGQDEQGGDILSVTAPNLSGKNVIYVPAGLHSVSPVANAADYYYKAHILNVPANTKLYLAPGAVLNGRVTVGGNNVTVTGRGMIRDTVRRNDIYDNFMIFAAGRANVVIEDIKIVDTRHFNVVFQSGSNFTIRNVRMLSNSLNSDGVATWGDVDGLSVTDSFIYTGDNIFVIGGSGGVSKNITVDNNIVGNWACTIFPQGDMDGYVGFTNLYVFRIDEGPLVGSLFLDTHNNTKGKFSILVENIFAQDSLTAAMLFRGSGQKLAEKKIVLKNITIPKPYDSGIRFYDSTRYPTGNYDITIENVAYTIGKRTLYLTDDQTADVVRDSDFPDITIRYQAPVPLTGVKNPGFETARLDGAPVYTNLTTGEGLTGLRPGDKLKVNLTLKTDAGTRDASVITALYHAGRLELAVLDSGEYGVGGKTFENVLTLPSETTSDCYLKTFAWSGVDSAQPLSGAFRFPADAADDFGWNGVAGCWSIDEAARYDGARSLKLTSAGGNAAVWQQLDVEKNTLYQTGFSIKGDARVRYTATAADGRIVGQNHLFNQPDGADWTYCTLFFYTGDSDQVKIQLIDDGDAGVSYIDGFGTSAFETPSDNLFTNPGFENGVTGWKFRKGGTNHTLLPELNVVRSGMASARLYFNNPNFFGMEQDVTAALKANGSGTYRFEAWLRADEYRAVPIQYRLMQRLGDTAESVLVTGVSVSDGKWTKLSANLNLSGWNGKDKVEVLIHSHSGYTGSTGAVFADDFSLVKLD
ncbi:hypothetical protein FACS189492_1150 [Clostridia bacterium]|nr:hypothetical protein FACS189492_1150 [Clostridia bacterium]